MKRILKFGILIIVLLVGFIASAEATEQYCFTINDPCPGVLSITVCGNSADEVIAEAYELVAVACYN